MEPITVGTRFRHEDEIWEVEEWSDELRGWVCFQPELTDETTQEVFSIIVEEDVFELDRHSAAVVQSILNLSFEQDDPEDVIGFMPLIPERVALEIEDPSGNYDGSVIDALWEVYKASEGSDSYAAAAQAGLSAAVRILTNLARVVELVRVVSIRTK